MPTLSSATLANLEQRAKDQGEDQATFLYANSSPEQAEQYLSAIACGSIYFADACYYLGKLYGKDRGENFKQNDIKSLAYYLLAHRHLERNVPRTSGFNEPSSRIVKPVIGLSATIMHGTGIFLGNILDLCTFGISKSIAVLSRENDQDFTGCADWVNSGFGYLLGKAFQGIGAGVGYLIGGIAACVAYLFRAGYERLNYSIPQEMQADLRKYTNYKSHDPIAETQTVARDTAAYQPLFLRKYQDWRKSAAAEASRDKSFMPRLVSTG